jgi:GNAT superfamily N-acetyltransferase
MMRTTKEVEPMPTSPVTVCEAASRRELDAASGLLRDYAISLGWDPAAGGWMADEIAGVPGPYAPPEGSLLVAFVGEAPAGVLGLQPVPVAARIVGTGAETAGELKRLYVRPEYRRHGVARALMTRAEAEARSRGYDALVLTTNAEMMPLAQGLYDSLGYQPTAPYRDDMPWPDIRWLRLELPSPAAAEDGALSSTDEAEEKERS